ncbi:MAG: DedA family protein [Thaumarchaeota archaeon]|nr:DedA family protein [Nitrososphaerota archaeon]
MVDIIDIFPFGEGLGYLGLLVVSFVGSAIPLIPAPFFFLLAIMGIDPKFDPHLLAFTSAIAATGGKMIIFYGSYYGRKMLGEKTKLRMRPMQKFVARYGWIAAFFAAATPVPDDIVYIPLGLSKYNPVKFLVATFVGKVLLSEGIVWAARTFGISIIQPYLETVPDPAILYISLGISGVIVTVMIIYILRIDWGKHMGKWFPWTIEEDDDDKDKN